MSAGTISSAKFAALLAQVRAKQAETAPAVNALQKQITEQKVEQVDVSSLGVGTSVEAIKEVIQEIVSPVPENVPVSETKQLGVSRAVVLNAKQQQFNDTVLKRKNAVLIGAAGTGKTTCMRTVTRNLIDSGTLHKLEAPTKYLSAGSYGAVIVSFTRKAVNNIRHAVVDELKKNTITLHRLLEFEPEFFEIEDDKGKVKKTMRFIPTRNRMRTLPDSITFVGFEESSMIGVDLYNLLQDAMPFPHQEVFLGDIQQLPPVFGAAILGFKMLELPVIELTEIYRQAAESPIIDVAWKLLKGDASVFNSKTVRKDIINPATNKPIPRISVPALDALSKKTDAGSVFFQPWQKPLTPDHGLLTATKQFCAWADSGYYNPNDDIILLPYNQAFGTIELNKGISQHLGLKREAPVYEVIAGFNTHYLAVGDRVLHDKEDAFIVAIEKNGAYSGKTPRPASVNLDRWGYYQEKLKASEIEAHMLADNAKLDDAAIDDMMALAAEDVEDRVQAASHVVTIRYAYAGEDDKPVYLRTAGELNSLLGGYAITVHKSQGSEWSKVFLVLHAQHSKMASRELLYTAVTRARKDLHIICETNTFEKGVKYQRIKGNTLAEKAEQFKGKLEKKDGDAVNQVPVKSIELDVVAVNSVQSRINNSELPVHKEVSLENNNANDKASAEVGRNSSTQTVEATTEAPLTAQEMLARIRAKRLADAQKKGA